MTAGSVFDYNKTPGSNSTIAGINIAAGCPSSSVGPAIRQHLADIAEAVVHSIVAGGTADALTVTFINIPAALTDGMEVKVRAISANATTTPTLTTNTSGDTGHTITKRGGTALAAGDIAAALYEMSLRYNLANTRWELLNPATSGAANVTGTLAVANGGTGDATLAAHGVLIGNGTSAVNVTAAGTVGQFLGSGGASADPTWQTAPQLQRQIFTTSGTFTTPAGTTTATRFKFTVVGGGGGGGSTSGAGTTGGGGGAGATAIYEASGVAAGTTAAVSVGAGGGGSAAGNASSVVFNGTTVSAGGGGAGSFVGAQSPGASGGVATNGDINIQGGAGTSGSAGLGGTGGNSTLGGGAVSGSVAGTVGGNYGGGGSGGGANAAGGAGANGIVIVEWVQ